MAHHVGMFCYQPTPIANLIWPPIQCPTTNLRCNAWRLTQPPQHLIGRPVTRLLRKGNYINFLLIISAAVWALVDLPQIYHPSYFVGTDLKHSGGMSSLGQIFHIWLISLLLKSALAPLYLISPNSQLGQSHSIQPLSDLLQPYLHWQLVCSLLHYIAVRFCFLFTQQFIPKRDIPRWLTAKWKQL